MKAVIGAGLIAAGAIALLTIPGAGILIGSELIAVEVASLGAVVAGTVMELSSIADALTDTPTTPQTVRSPAAPWKVIYGNIRTGGTVIDCNSYGDNFHYCDQIITLACHPTNGVQLHTEVIAGDATFPAFGGVYINGQGVQFRNNAQGGSAVPGSIGYDIDGIPFGYASSNDVQDLNQNHYVFGTHVYMEAYNGTGKSYQAGDGQIDNQVSQFYITQGPADHWNSNCTMMIDAGTSAYTGGTTESPIYANEQGVPKGITYVYLRLLYSSTLWSGGLPQSLRFDVQGKNDIWDPRLNSGAGGYAFTNNAALVTADFLMNPYFGMGYKMSDINQEQLIAAANICDTQIPLASGGTIAEYTINGEFDTSQNPATTLQTMLAAMGGDISYVGGQWYIFPGTYVFPSAVIDSSMLVGPMDISLNQKPRNLINSVKGSFICPAAIDTFGSPNIFLNEQPNIFNGQWQPQSYPPYAMDSQHGYASDVWLAADGQKLYKDVSFPFTTNAATCQRLAKQILMKNRTGNGIEDSQNKGLTFSVDCNLKAYDTVAHDTVWFNYPRFNWTAPPSGFDVPTQDIPEYTYTEFEVVNTSLNYKEEDGKPPVPVYTLHLRATSPDVYLWNPADELPMTENKYPQFANTMQVASPTNLTAISNSSTAVVNPDGTQSDGILATWTAPTDGYVLNGGELVVQIMPVVNSTQTYTSTAITGGGVDNVIVLSGTTNPYIPGQALLLGGAGINGVPWNGTVFSVSGQDVTLLIAPPTAVTNGAILGDSWQTVAKLAGNTSECLLTGLLNGEQYYVQVYAMNSAGITSTPVVAGPVTATNGNSSGLIPYSIQSSVIKSAIDINGNVTNLGGTAASSITPIAGLMPAEPGADVTATNGNILLQNPNFAAGDTGWTLGAGWGIDLFTGYAGSPYVAAFHGTTAAITNNQKISCAAESVLSASAFCEGAQYANGDAYVRINFYEQDGTFLATVNGNAMVSNIGWQQSRAVAIAPANTGYATVDFGILYCTAGPWYVGGFSASLLANSLDEVPDGATFIRPRYVNPDNTFHVSTAFVPQGSFTPIIPIAFDVSYTVPSSGQATVNCSVTAGEIARPDGSVLTIPGNTTQTYNINPSTTYSFYARISNSTGDLDVTPGPQTALSAAAAQYQQNDGWIAIGYASVTSPARPTSGSSSGGGTITPPAPCPDGRELVNVAGRGIVPCSSVVVGDAVEGWNFDAQRSEFSVVKKVRHVESTTWVRVDGHKVSPHHPISRLNRCEWINAFELARSLDFDPGIRVQLMVDRSDYDDQNFLIYSRDGKVAFVMHNAQIIS